jgi:hypothetical protein
LDIELLIRGTKQEAKKKLLEEIREEALEAAIAKVNVQIQLDKEEEEERKNLTCLFHILISSTLFSLDTILVGVLLLQEET